MDNVCNRCLFSIPSKVEMAEEQEYLKLSQGKYFVENIILEMYNLSCGGNDTQQCNKPSS